MTTHERTGLPLPVTEIGATMADPERTADGVVDDQDRSSYLQGHIEAVERARAAGADVRAYVLWTLLDSFEWAEGYTETFGLVHVDRRERAGLRSSPTGGSRATSRRTTGRRSGSAG